MPKGFVPLAIVVVAVFLFVVVFFVYPAAGEEPRSYEEGSCEAPLYLADTFPPSPVEPPLPPLNEHPYQEPDYVCFDFARQFCKDARDVEAIKQCFILLFDSHAINMISFTDDAGNSWVCVVEPQTNEYYCMPAEDWTALDQDRWIKDTLCQGYYNYSTKKCDKKTWVVPLCQGMEGSSCSRDESGDIALCFPETGKKPDGLKCTCKYIPYEVCSWEPFLKSGTARVFE